MTVLNEVRFEKDEQGNVITYAPLKYTAVGELFEDLWRVASVWPEALQALNDPPSKPWSASGDAYTIEVNRDGVVFSNQFRDDEDVRVTHAEARALIDAFIAVRDRA